MLQSLREWLINICTAVFFITAVELILPDNSMKKYAKFVLGLILITVFMNPIIKLFNKNFDINTYTTAAIENFDKKKSVDEFGKYKEKNINNTIEVFKSNLQASCERKLKEKYPGTNYKVQVEAAYDNEHGKVDIKDVKVGVKDGSVEKVKKVTIGDNSASVNKSEDMNNQRSTDIKKYLSDELNISKDIIRVQKL